MCELLGLAFNAPISPGLSFRGFRHRAKRNRDGWGLAAITPTKARITKEAVRADQSDVSESLRDDPAVAAPIFIGHVRFASCGDVSLENTHPFTRRMAPFCRVSLRDEDWEADLPEEKAPDQKGFVVASRKLTDGEDWHDFTPGSLMVFERGDVVYGAEG